MVVATEPQMSPDIRIPWQKHRKLYYNSPIQNLRQPMPFQVKHETESFPLCKFHFPLSSASAAAYAKPSPTRKPPITQHPLPLLKPSPYSTIPIPSRITTKNGWLNNTKAGNNPEHPEILTPGWNISIGTKKERPAPESKDTGMCMPQEWPPPAGASLSSITNPCPAWNAATATADPANCPLPTNWQTGHASRHNTGKF